MSRVRPPENIEIAALRKKQKTLFDPMAPGVGTPWEDRGTHGTVGAFFKTCIMSLSSPGKLMNAIRRPETTNDARAFLYGLSGIWAITAAVHCALWIWSASRDQTMDYDQTTAIVKCALCFAAGGGGCFLLHQVYCSIYEKLAATEKDAVLLPQPLIYNVQAYAFGPSLLAIIPLAGPPLALLWILVDLMVAGASRFRLRTNAAIIDALLGFAAIVAIAVLGPLIVHLLLHYVAGYDAVTKTVVPVVPK